MPHDPREGLHDRTQHEMDKTCKLCGRLQPLWLDTPLREGECADGGTQLCEDAKQQAYGEAMRRKVCPDAFDGNGVILSGAVGRVMKAMVAAGLNPFTGRPASAAGKDVGDGA